MQPYTFNSLSALDKKTLDKLIKSSSAPEIDDVIGWEYRGWNLNAATRLTGTRKFKKGFFGQSGIGHAWGYNVPVK
ncbi:MAG: hypothetical protein WAN36_16615, partial [Calditrichia bacterium]